MNLFEIWTTRWIKGISNCFLLPILLHRIKLSFASEHFKTFWKTIRIQNISNCFQLLSFIVRCKIQLASDNYRKFASKSVTVSDFRIYCLWRIDISRILFFCSPRLRILAFFWYFPALFLFSPILTFIFKIFCFFPSPRLSFITPLSLHLSISKSPTLSFSLVQFDISNILFSCLPSRFTSLP